jgi:hypothetical protein
VVERRPSIIPNIVRGFIVKGVVRNERINMKTKRVAITKDKYEDGLSLEISHNGYQTTSIGNLDLEDLKKLRKVVRKAIREYENN